MAALVVFAAATALVALILLECPFSVIICRDLMSIAKVVYDTSPFYFASARAWWMFKVILYELFLFNGEHE